MLARQQGRGLTEVAVEAGADVLGGASRKAVLDLDGDEPTAREQALRVVVLRLARVEAWLDGQPVANDPQVRDGLATAQQLQAQDVPTDAAGHPVRRHGVARERRISLEEAQMRHGRKSRRVRVDGYKRHVLHALDTGLGRAVGRTPATAPEAAVTPALVEDLAAQGSTVADLDEVHIDRAYLTSPLVRERPAHLEVYGKAWRVYNGDRFPQTAFALDGTQQLLRCPAGVVLPVVPGGVVHFPAATCIACPLRTRCTASAHGRSVSIHPDERLLQELRQRQSTSLGRAHLRERVAVEHSLAHVGHWQGRRARYRGVRKHLFDLRRSAVVFNLHVLVRFPDSLEGHAAAA